MGHWLQILQQLVSMGVPSEKWGEVIKALSEQQQAGTQQATLQVGQQAAQSGPPTNAYGSTSQQRGDSSLRARSRSPARNNSAYAANGHNSYRERSPRQSFSPSNGNNGIPPPNGPKWLDFNPNLPPNHIKVLSRTMFVGGTTCPEPELREVFARFGNVQSVICNPQKRHAFVKMYTRAESLRAKTEMETTQDQEILSRARSTKWGVGFGPRECCDYNEGVSVIPIDRLTDADRRWILTAEYGGNGGKDITYGQVMEEPDIEIGAGVSSKAISLRVGAGTGATGGREGKGKQQNQQQHHRGRGRDHGRDRDHRGGSHRGSSNHNNPNPYPGPRNEPDYGLPPQPYMPQGMQQPMPQPMAQGFPQGMPQNMPGQMPGFQFPPQGGYNMFNPGMPPFPMQ